MKFDISLLRLAGSLASYSAQRQSVLAENIANSDTPGYRAKDLRPFGEMLEKSASEASHMRATRPGHIGQTRGSAGAEPQEGAGLRNLC